MAASATGARRACLFEIARAIAPNGKLNPPSDYGVDIRKGGFVCNNDNNKTWNGITHEF
jgi:hypothetical protein